MKYVLYSQRYVRSCVVHCFLFDGFEITFNGFDMNDANVF